jgi:hypothetical protein
MEQLGLIQDVQLIECHPKYKDVLASVSGNNVLIWDLNSPKQEKVSSVKDLYMCVAVLQQSTLGGFDILAEFKPVATCNDLAG